MIDPFGAVADAAVLAATWQATLSMLFSRYLHMLVLPKSMHPLDIHLPITLDQQSMDPFQDS